MISFIIDLVTGKLFGKPDLKLNCIILILVFSSLTLVSQEESPKSENSVQSGIIYRNPRVYNVNYTFELCPDKDSIDPSKDLKLWIPVPREWDSQRAVKIISVNPPPQAEYEDPEHRNRMLFWDFGKDFEKYSYKMDIKFRLESYEIHAEVDPEHLEHYDKSSQQYAFYTRSSHTIAITPRITEMALEAVGDEKNPYRQAELIFRFVRTKVQYKLHRLERGVGTEVLLNFPLTDEMTGEEYYEGACGQQSAMFIALCRAVGIPARAVIGFVGWNPWIKEKDLELFLPVELNLSPAKLAGTQHYLAIMPHNWAEFYLPGYGWIPVDVTGNGFGHSEMRLIMSKGFDVLIGPQSPINDSEGYGFQFVLTHDGAADQLQTGVWNIARIRIAKATLMHQSDPFPADAYTEYSTNLYPESKAEEKIVSWRKNFILTLLCKSLGNKDQSNDDLFANDPELNSSRQTYMLCLLNEITGKDKFQEIFEKYLNLRITTGKPVSTEKFQEIAESIFGSSLDVFFNKMIATTSLSELKLDYIINTLTGLISMGNVNSIIDSHKQLKKENPDDYDFSKEQLNRLGVGLRYENMFDESIIIYKWIIELYPDWFEGYNGIADVYRLKGDKELAITNYTRSLELYPDVNYAKWVNKVIKELTEEDN